MGALCCVNIAGSRNPNKWDGPHPDNFSLDTFDAIVETNRAIIDAVKPNRTTYTLETIRGPFPSTAENYLELVRAIDRPAAAVHLDPVSMINSPELIYENAKFLRHCLEVLGPFIKGVHAKDIVLRETLTVHLDECRPGLGMLDYRVFMSEVQKAPRRDPVLARALAAGGIRSGGGLRAVGGKRDRAVPLMGRADAMPASRTHQRPAAAGGFASNARRASTIRR